MIMMMLLVLLQLMLPPLQNVRKEVEKLPAANYKRWSDEKLLEVGEWASVNGPAAAKRHFDALDDVEYAESSIRRARDAYELKKKRDVEAKKRKRDGGGEAEDVAEPPRKQGRPRYLQDCEEKMLYNIVKNHREATGRVTARFVAATARGVVRTTNPHLLEECGGTYKFSEDWGWLQLNRWG